MVIQSSIRNVRRWWTQSNNEALYVSQELLLQSLIQTPYINTSSAGMNSVEFNKQQPKQQPQPSTPPTVSTSSSMYESDNSHFVTPFMNHSHHNNHNNTRYYNSHHHQHHNHDCMSHHHLQYQQQQDRQYYTDSYHPYYASNSISTSCQSRCSSAVQDQNAIINNTKAQQKANTRTTVIITHGFGSGLGFFYKNVDLLLQQQEKEQYSMIVDRVVLVDWFGMGGSQRPGYNSGRPICNTMIEKSIVHTQQSINFFIEPFHEWFQTSILSSSSVSQQQQKQQPVEKENIILVGHSLGGYLCSHYAMKYPQHLSKLVLVSPVGFSNKPTTTSIPILPKNRYHQHQYSENLYSTISYDHHYPKQPSSRSPSQHSTVSNINKIESHSSSINNDIDTSEDGTTITKPSSSSSESSSIATFVPSSITSKPILRILSSLWKSNVTPQQLIRICGATRGRANIYHKLKQKLSINNKTTTTTTFESTSSTKESKNIQKNVLNDDYDIQLLADYLYHITVADPSGEFAMNSLLEPTLITLPKIPSSSKVNDVPKPTLPKQMSSVTPPSPPPPPSSFKTMPINHCLEKDNSTRPNKSTKLSDLTKRNSTYIAMGITAREPIHDILAQTLDTSYGLQSVKVLYGSHDWMRPNEIIARQSLQQLHLRTGIETSVNVIPNAGHHLYIENPIDFVRHIVT